MNTNDLINYYVALIILQYSNLGNALATIQAHMTALIQNQIIDQVRNAFNVQTAIGAQLDILAGYVGVSRLAYGLAAGLYWSLPSYSDTLPGTFNGWASYGDANPPTILWFQYNDADALLYSLTDTQLRLLIQLKAALGSCPMGLGEIDNILYSYFGTNVNLLDNENMTIVYQHNHLDTDPNQLWKVAELENVPPHQAGVNVTFAEV